MAGGLNYCALDARRRPLTGLELRACWAERPESLQAAARLAGPGGRRPSAAPDPGPRRGFVPVEEIHPNRPAGAPVEGPAADHAPGGAAPFIALEVDGWDGRTSLFGEPEH